MALWDFLFDSEDLPWGLQVFWKALLLTMAGMLIWIAATSQGPAPLFYPFGSVFVLFAVFTKLGGG